MKIRKFDTGATRDTADGKMDFEGFLSPLSLHYYAQYLDKHRLQPDGSLRGSDNWQLGMELNVYMKSDLRHVMEAWAIHRGYYVYHERIDGKQITHMLYKEPENTPETWEKVTMKDALCGQIFNAMGYLHELMKQEKGD
jgi:hypothetical protein